MTSPAAQVLAAINCGDVDEHLKTISEALTARWRAVQLVKGLEFNVGDKVRINGTRKYNGMRGTVTGKRGKYISVEFGPFNSCGFTAGLLEKVA